MDYGALGRNLRMARHQKGMTQEQLADKAGISATFLGHIERGTRKASFETIINLANVLNVSLDDLFAESLVGNRSSRGKGSGDSEKKREALETILKILTLYDIN